MAERWTAKDVGLLVGIFVVAGGGVLLWEQVIRPKVDHAEAVHQSGRAAGAVLSGEVVVLLDHVTVSHRVRDTQTDRDDWRDTVKTRLVVVDAATGARLSTKIVEAVGQCEAASPGRMWCDFDKLALWDARAAAPLITMEDAIARAAVGRPVSKLWRVDGGKATQLLDDGRVAILDAATMAVTRDDKVPPSLRSASPFGGLKPTQGSITPAATSPCTSFDASDFMSINKKWKVQHANSDRAHVVHGKLASAESFLKPRILDGGDPPLMFHHTSLVAADDSLKLSRLTPAGGTAWTIDVRRASCENAGPAGALFVVTTDDPQRRALGIDPSAGVVRWEVSAK